MENEVKPPSTVSPSVGAAIAKGRQDKKDAEGKSMSQKDLATKINEKPSVVSRESSSPLRTLRPAPSSVSCRRAGADHSYVPSSASLSIFLRNR